MMARPTPPAAQHASSAPVGSQSTARIDGPAGGASLAPRRTIAPARGGQPPLASRRAAKAQSDEALLRAIAPWARRGADLAGSGGLIIGCLLALAMLVRCALRIAGL